MLIKLWKLQSIFAQVFNSFLLLFEFSFKKKVLMSFNYWFSDKCISVDFIFYNYYYSVRLFYFISSGLMLFALVTATVAISSKVNNIYSIATVTVVRTFSSFSFNSLLWHKKSMKNFHMRICDSFNDFMVLIISPSTFLQTNFSKKKNKIRDAGTTNNRLFLHVFSFAMKTNTRLFRKVNIVVSAEGDFRLINFWWNFALLCDESVGKAWI